MEGDALTFIVTSEKEAVQGEVEMVHLKIAEPTVNPVIPVVGKLGEVIIPFPEIKVHWPVPESGVFAAMVVEFEQRD